MDAENQGTFFPDFSIQRMIDCINSISYRANHSMFFIISTEFDKNISD